jgi:hypothetical protein
MGGMGVMQENDTIADLTAWAFARTPVVMVNEAHDGMARCSRTRRVGLRIVQAAHQAGVRRLAMEALPRLDGGEPGPILHLPEASGGYLAQQDLRDLISAALGLGWTLWAYEAQLDARLAADRERIVSLDFTNWREREQALNLSQLLTGDASPLLVWCGNGHASKEAIGDWTPMGAHFAGLSGIDPFVIDQTATIEFPGTSEPWKSELVLTLAGVLTEHGGTVAVRREHAPEPLDEWTWVDAVILSTDNAFS